MSAPALITRAEAALVETERLAHADLESLTHEQVIHLMNVTTMLSMYAERARMATTIEMQERRSTLSAH